MVMLEPEMVTIELVGANQTDRGNHRTMDDDSACGIALVSAAPLRHPGGKNRARMGRPWAPINSSS